MLNPKVSPLVFPRLLLTGAAGQLGRELRPRLKAYCDVLRVSDQNDLGMAAVGEEIQTADLANASDMQTLLKDVNAVVHLGGVSTEQPWAPILASNIVGMVNLYEAARLQGTKHIGYRALDSSDVFRHAVETRPHFSKAVLLSKSHLTANKHCRALILVKAQKDLIDSQEY